MPAESMLIPGNEPAVSAGAQEGVEMVCHRCTVWMNSICAKLLAVGFGLLFISVVAAETYVGRVVRVADGDTITVLDQAKVQHKVRLAGIDAPEKRQPFGQVSKRHLASLVADEMVLVEFMKRDRYRREVGKVVVGGRDVNLAQLEAGLAWHYRRYAHEQPYADRLEYAAAEAVAREAREGLWVDAQPVPPWEYRHRRP